MASPGNEEVSTKNTTSTLSSQGKYESALDPSIPETKVLAIASHAEGYETNSADDSSPTNAQVAYGYVGNTMATFVMQSLGCEVAAINTVHFSNHTGYQRFKGTRTPASEIANLYDGLKASYLTDFDVLLSGYIPSADSLEAVRDIARDLRNRSTMEPGGFFWILDPVMGDQGRLYVSEELVAGYKRVIREADLIVPNQFEASVLTGVNIGTETEGAAFADIAKAVQVLHKDYSIKHAIVTSVQVNGRDDVLCVVGSSATSRGDSRLFFIEVPALDCIFSGTGDMFAALLVSRLRQACQAQGTLNRDGWTSDDNVQATDLPLAKAMCKVLDSMHMVLEKTMVARNREMASQGTGSGSGVDGVEGHDQNDDVLTKRHLMMTKAAEVKVVQNVRDLAHPFGRYKATVLEV